MSAGPQPQAGAGPVADVVVVGGGVAGLAAAAALARRDLTVRLLEARSRLGGRAASVIDPQSGEPIDNCQHVVMGCCRSFFRFCELTGVRSLLHPARELYFIEPVANGIEPRAIRFRDWPLPAPWHLAPALLGLKFFTFRERVALGRGLRRLAATPAEALQTVTIAQWLEHVGQPQRLVEWFWTPVLVSALSELPDRISAAYARQVFVEGFLQKRCAWRVYLPAVSLDRLYTVAVGERLQEMGVRVECERRVREIVVDGGRARGVRLADGTWIGARAVVSAVRWDQALKILPDEVANHDTIAGARRLEAGAIAGVHLWFDRRLTDLPHCVLPGRLTQWLFARQWREDRQRTAAFAGPETAAGTDGNGSMPKGDVYYQAVISAAHRLIPGPAENVVDQVAEELRRAFPRAADARLLHSRCIIERRAVFVPQPGVDEHRPPQQTPVDNLQLAGDWTQTHWPATMEGAVRSGFRAAENLLRFFARG